MAFVRPAAGVEGGENGHGAVVSCDRVGIVRARAVKLLGAVAEDAHEAASRFDIAPIGRVTALGAGRAVTRHGAHHQAGIHLSQLVVAEVKVAHDAGGVVFHEDVGFRNEPLEDGLTFGLAQVEANCAFVAVELVEVAAAVVMLGPHIVGDPHEGSGCGLGGEFYLDHIGAEIGQVAAANRAGPVGRHLDHAKSGERPRARPAGRGWDRPLSSDASVRPLKARSGDLGGVFAETRRVRTGHARGAHHAVGEAGRLELAPAGFDPPKPLPVEQLRVAGDVGHIVHGADGDAQLLAGVVDLLLRPRGRPFAEGREDLGEACPPGRRVEQRFVFEEIETLQEQEEVRVGDEVEEVDEAIGAPCVRTARAALDNALMRPNRREPGLVAERSLLVRNLDALPFARFARVPERRQGGYRPVQTTVERHLVTAEGERMALARASDVAESARCVFREFRGNPT